MRLMFLVLAMIATPYAHADSVSRTIEARPIGNAVRWQPDYLELVSTAPNSLRIINRTNQPQCFQLQNLTEPVTVGPGETRIMNFPAYQHGRFAIGCPGEPAVGGNAEFR